MFSPLIPILLFILTLPYISTKGNKIPLFLRIKFKILQKFSQIKKGPKALPVFMV